jgi:plastocyanin
MRKPRALAVLVALLGVPHAVAAGTVGGTVTIGGAPARDTVVYLERGRPAPAGPPRRVSMDQKDLAFVPGVLPVVRGTIIDFTNSDDVQHNVFTPSRVGGKFDLGTYSRGESRSVTLSEAGEVVVLCNIHMEMEARILVLDEPTFGQTRADGTFSVSGVEAGTYRLRIWRRGWLAHTEIVMVPEGDALTLDVRAER